jgi:glyoxylase-like metal-dependent hydrolase (beta-lactamase superfamily II)
VDAPTGDESFLDDLDAALRAAGDAALAQVIVTHAHPDHIDGATAVHARWPQAVFRKRAPLPDDDGIAWQVIEKEPMIVAGDAPLWLLHTPGHAPDHSCLFDVHGGTLIGGDLAINGSTVAIPADYGGSLREYLHSLRVVLELQPRVILPGHGDPILQPASLLRGYLSHRMAREQQVLECLAAGLTTADAIVERLYAATAEALKPAARQNVIAHLRKLVEDGRVEAAGDDWHLRSA